MYPLYFFAAFSLADNSQTNGPWSNGNADVVGVYLEDLS